MLAPPPPPLLLRHRPLVLSVAVQWLVELLLWQVGWHVLCFQQTSTLVYSRRRMCSRGTTNYYYFSFDKENPQKGHMFLRGIACSSHHSFVHGCTSNVICWCWPCLQFHYLVGTLCIQHCRQILYIYQPRKIRRQKVTAHCVLHCIYIVGLTCCPRVNVHPARVSNCMMCMYPKSAPVHHHKFLGQRCTLYTPGHLALF